MSEELSNPNQSVIDFVGSLADKFHKILGSFTAKELLDKSVREHRSQPEKLRKSLEDNLLVPEQITKICGDAFEECVMFMAKLGSKDVTIHECKMAPETLETYGQVESDPSASDA